MARIQRYDSGENVTADENDIATHWAASGAGEDINSRIVSALVRASKPLASLSIEDLAPVDHLHAGGFPATVELGNRLPIRADQHIVDIGCGIGGPARYFAQRFHCKVSGIDITKPFVIAANKLTALLGMQDQVSIEYGRGEQLPFGDGVFDGGYSQHVTMNVADRSQFFAEVYRVLKKGAFFALTEQGLGPNGDPLHPSPWSDDGSGEHLVTPIETRSFLQAAGFEDIAMEDTGPKYLEAYTRVIEAAETRDLPPLGLHILIGSTFLEKIRNAARNIAEGRTHPVRVFCRKPQ